MSRTTYIEGLPAGVAAAIAKSGISTLQLEVATGISRHTLRRRLARPDQFTLSEVAAISAVLGMDVSELVESGVAA